MRQAKIVRDSKSSVLYLYLPEYYKFDNAFIQKRFKSFVEEVHLDEEESSLEKFIEIHSKIYNRYLDSRALKYEWLCCSYHDPDQFLVNFYSNDEKEPSGKDIDL